MGGKHQALLSPDPRVLLASMAEALRSQQRERPFAPILVLAPTRRLVDYLSHALPLHCGALAGVQIHHHRGFALSVHETVLGETPRELPSAWLELLLRSHLRPERSQLQRYLQEMPAACSAWLATFRDLRDAGAFARPIPRRISSRARESLQLYATLQETLQQTDGRQLLDGAALSRSTASLVSALPTPYAAVHHYGAYDLIGVHRELLRSLGERTNLHLWVPGPSPSGAHRFQLAESLGAQEQQRPPPERCQVLLTSSCGRRQEVRHAVRRLLAWHTQDQVPWQDMALLVRNLAPYRSALQTELRALGLNADELLPTPPAQQPGVLTLRLFLELLLDPDSSRLRQRCLRYAPGWEQATGSLQAWLSDWQQCDDLTRCFAFLSDLAGTFDPEGIGPAFASMGEALALLPLATYPFPAARRELLEVLLRNLRSFPSRASSWQPLQIVEVTQARGIPWRRAVLLGCNDGQFPQLPSEDAFLPDRDRRILAEAWGLPVPLKGAALEEERYLFELTLSAVQEQLCISFLRTDGQGRTLSPSPFLRDLDEIALPIRFSPHPLEEARQVRDQLRCLSPAEALRGAALEGVDRASVLTFAEELDLSTDRLRSGVAMLEAVERFQGDALPFDGVVDAALLEKEHSVSAIATLGKCPLQFLFRYGMKIPEPQEPPDELEFSDLELGNALHRTLELIYQQLDQPELREQGVDLRLQWVREHLAALWRQASSQALQGRDVPEALCDVRGQAWQKSLLEFLTEDLEIVAVEGWQVAALEEPFSCTLHLPQANLKVRGRLDRILKEEDGCEWVADYKSSSIYTLREQSSLSQMLTARSLQLPLYWLARLQEQQSVQRLGFIRVRGSVRPGASPTAALSPYWDLDLAALHKHLDQLRLHLGTLAQLLQNGRFPMVSDSTPFRGTQHQCGRCAYRRACRHAHSPSVHRNEAASPHRPYYEMIDGKGR